MTAIVIPLMSLLICVECDEVIEQDGTWGVHDGEPRHVECADLVGELDAL